MSYILSILIPTKNRVEYLQFCVNQVLNACSNRVQVVVQDNSDMEWDKASEISMVYPNFNYYYKKGAISFVENFSMAIEHAKGEYFCFIGDDDGVLPEIERLAEWMKMCDIDAVSQNISATYFWPNSQNSIPGTENGLLKLYYANNNMQIKHTDKELRKLVSAAGQNYLSRGLVKPYHGIVRTRLMEKVKEVTGVYIDGLSPDIYVSVALSCYIKRVFVINYPITISGIGAKSGSAASANGTHTGRLSDAPHFVGHEDYKWDSLVPEIYSVETIWADSALHAFRSYSTINVDKYFCKEYLLHICRNKYSKFAEELRSYKDKYSINMVKYFISFVMVDLMDSFKRFLKKIKRKKEDYVEHKGVKDIIEAERLIRHYLIENAINFDVTLEKIRQFR